MKIFWARTAWEDYQFWSRHHPEIHARINALLRNIRTSRGAGLGAPVPLGAGWEGFWSRRIDFKHRLVYRVGNRRISVAQCRYHDGYFLSALEGTQFNPAELVSGPR